MWENFGVGKNWRIWRIEGHSPIFYPPMFLFRISFSYTYMRLIRQYFTLQLIQISAFAKIFPRTVNYSYFINLSYDHTQERQ